jgi:hypothetical protein
MTSKTLERLYPQLIAAERFPAMLAAFNRGDEAEAARLAATAPWLCVKIPDYHLRAEAFLIMALVQQATILSLAGWFARFKAAALSAELDSDLEGARFAATVASLYAWQLTRDEEAWRAFCDEIGSEGDPLQGMPGDDFRDVMNNLALAANVSTEDIAAMLGQKAEDLITVEERTKQMVAEWEFWQDKLDPQ